jgi:uncharacterized protein YdeI (YjbR/CyaY-like superfamily)
MEKYQPSIAFRNVDEWRDWLKKNGNTEKEIFVIVYNKKSKIESIKWFEVIKHALCFGWVDSIAHKRDDNSCFLRFTKRNDKSNWGRKNIERARELIEMGLMEKEGFESIEIAKKNGKWIE